MKLTRSLWTETLSEDRFQAFGARYLNDPVGFVHDCFIWNKASDEGPTKYQEEIMAALVDHRRACARGPHGLGKAQPHDLVIDTPGGKRRFGDLMPGDSVFGVDGRPTRVLAVHERGVMDVYRIEFNDGTSTLCAGDHLWTVRRADWKPKTGGPIRWDTWSTEQLIEQGVTRSNGKYQARKWAVPTTAPLDYPFRWVPADPYALGAWLGDGARNTARITGRDVEVAEHIRQAGYTVKKIQYGEDACPVWSVHGLASALRKIGVLDCTAREKFVPTVYLENIVAVRKEILRGLLDTDGYITKEGTISFTSVSRQLVEDVAWLARSLGGMARVHETSNEHGPYWSVLLTLPDDRWFYIERKQARVRPISQKRYLWRWISAIEPVAQQEVRCITVDREDGLYLANDCIVTHNSAMVSWIVWWFTLTREASLIDWKVPTTASAWRQLTKYLWPEVHKWERRLNWAKIGRQELKPKDELTTRAINLRYGQAFAVASDRPELIEGAHADHILYIFDESKVIPDGTWDSAEGAMTGEHAYWLAVSTPGTPSGRFYSIQTKQQGYEDWWVRHVQLQEAVDAGRISPEWVEDRRVQWGEHSSIYQNRVLGNFAQEEEDVLIPLHWVEDAVERWYSKEAQAVLRTQQIDQIGVDVARMGGDKTVIAKRHDWVLAPLEKHGKIDTMRTTGLLVPHLRQSPRLSLGIDAIGVGAGVFDRATEQFPDNENIFSFQPQAKTDFMDATGLWEFFDTYSAAWWNLRELIDPNNPRKLENLLALPPDDDLIRQITTPRWRILSSGKIQVEKKEDIKDRIGESPDCAEATVIANWQGDMGGLSFA